MKTAIHLFIIFYSFSSFVCAQEKAKLTDKQIFEVLGQLNASGAKVKFNKLEMNEKEINAFISGFKVGLKTKINKDEMQDIKEEVIDLVNKRKNDYFEKHPVIFPLDTKIATIDGKETTLKELLKDKKGVLLDFYASWCAPCMALMPKLKEKEIALKEKGILVAGMNTENLEDAKKVYDEHGITFTWLIEPENNPFSDLLEVDSIPRMILIDKTGLVIFNEHPENEYLPIKLETLK